MKKYVVYLFSICLILLILFHILAKIWPDSLYLDLVSLMGLCSFLCIFALLPLRQLRYPIGLILLAMGMLLVHGEADLWSGLWTGLREMRNLIPLIIVIPMFGWILNQGVYIPALLDRSKKWMHRSSTVYGGLLLIMMAGTLFISLGAIFLMYTLASTLLFGQAREWMREKDMIIMQGFALSALWSLTEASMVLALEATRAPVVATLFHALLLSLIGFVLGLLFFLHRARRGGLTFDPARLHSTFDGSARQAWRLIAQFFVILIGFLSTILASLFVIKMSIIDVVPLSILLWTFIYFLYKRELGTLYDRLKRYLTKDIGQRSRELSFILSSGLMIAALVETGWGEQLFLFIMEAEKIPFINMLLLLPLMIVLFGLVGMPPVPSMVLLTAVLMRLPLEYSATELVLSLLLGNMVTFLLSPVTMPTLLLSSLNHLSTLTNGLRSNFAYAFVFFIVAPLYIQLLHRWELG